MLRRMAYLSYMGNLASKDFNRNFADVLAIPYDLCYIFFILRMLRVLYQAYVTFLVTP